MYDLIKYLLPQKWIYYDKLMIIDQLVEAKAAILSLSNIPYQKNWADNLQILQLKREIAGTSKIEGAYFTDDELDIALKENPTELHTRSQKQVSSALKAYRWIASLKNDRTITKDLICKIHSLIITGADDDHCPPGILRSKDQNVIFGIPRHRGVTGGNECEDTFDQFCNAITSEFLNHDPLIQALATHYHFAAMHPFLDGNGRTARALEALILQKLGLKNSLFIAMSNYYYEEKNNYLKILAEVRNKNHDLTPFLVFGLKGISIQCRKLFNEIKHNLSKALFKNVMYDLFNRLQTKKKRIIAERQITILKVLLDSHQPFDNLKKQVIFFYKNLSNPEKALVRDINYLLSLKAITYTNENNVYVFFIRLEWATEITESEFFKKIKELPKAKTYGFLYTIK